MLMMILQYVQRKLIVVLLAMRDDVLGVYKELIYIWHTYNTIFLCSCVSIECFKTCVSCVCCILWCWYNT